MGLMDIFFPGEARNRKARAFRESLQRQQKQWEEERKTGEEKLKDSVAAKSLEESLAEFYKSDQSRPLEKRNGDLDWYRCNVLGDLKQNYERGNLEIISDAVLNMSRNDFFAKSFLYQTGERKEELWQGRTNSELEPVPDVITHSSDVTFQYDHLLNSAEQLVDLAQKAYRRAEFVRNSGGDISHYQANLKLGGAIYDLLSRTADYLVRSGRYDRLSDKHKKVLKEIKDMIAEIKPESHSKAFGIISLASLVGGIFLSTSKLTGNVVGISFEKSSLIGAAFLIIGLIFGFLWIKNKKKRKVKKTNVKSRVKKKR